MKSNWHEHRFNLTSVDRFADRLRGDRGLAARFLEDARFARHVAEELFLDPAVQREFGPGLTKREDLAKMLGLVAHGVLEPTTEQNGTDAPKKHSGSTVLAGHVREQPTAAITAPAPRPASPALRGEAFFEEQRRQRAVARASAAPAPAEGTAGYYARTSALIYGDRQFASEFASDAALRSKCVAKAWADPESREDHQSIENLATTWLSVARSLAHAPVAPVASHYTTVCRELWQNRSFAHTFESDGALRGSIVQKLWNDAEARTLCKSTADLEAVLLATARRQTCGPG